MFSKKVVSIFGAVILLIGIVGGVIAVEDRYVKCVEFCQLDSRLNRKILRDDIRDYQRQKWDMERNYGKEEAQKKREYQEIDLKQIELQRELDKK